MATQQARWAKVNLGDTDEYGEIIGFAKGARRPFIVRCINGLLGHFDTIQAVDDATVKVLEQHDALLCFVRNMTDATEAPAALERCRALGLDL